MFRYFALISFSALAVASVLSAQEAPTVASEEAQQTDEALAWEAAQQSSASADVFAFIQQYPDGEYAEEAKARMIDLLLAEMADTPAAPSDLAASPDSVPEPETSGQDDVVRVTFSTPLQTGAPEIVGQSIEELILGSPLYPPVEGLPAEYWEEQQCSSCHEWEQTNLCAQANTYLTDAGAENVTKQHPYGGTFKSNLRDWATGGCE